MGLRYSNIAFSFSLVIMLALSFEKLFQSVGRMKVTMEGLLIGCVTNIILDPMFIFGIGFFPELGIAGAALATGIGQVSTLLFYLFVYQRSKMPVCISCKYLVRNAKIDQKLYAIGIPAMLNLALPSLLVSCLNAMLAGYSYSYVVILGIYYKLQTFIYLPTNGIVQGMRPVIGYNYGAGEHQRVKKIYQVTLFMSGCIMVIGTVICLTASKPLIGLFTGNPTTIESGKTALRIISAGFFLSAVSVTSSGALEGLGKGVESLVISLCRCVIIMIPMAYLFSRIWGPIGIWNAFWVTEAVTAGISIFIYKKSVESGKEKKRYANISTGCVQNRDNSDIINVKNS